MTINWDDLRCFLAVAETGSLTAAANRLDSSQPTVGRRLKALESALDAVLVRRVKDKYLLTPLGETVLNLAQGMELAVFDIDRHASGVEVTPGGRVRIATTECIASTWLVRKLPELAEKFPDVEVEILTGISMADLMRREADIALRVGVSGPEELECYRAGIVDFGLYGSDAYFKQHASPNTVEDLVDHVGFESLGSLSGLPQVIKYREVIRRHIPFAFDSILTQREAVLNGLGIMTLPKYLCYGVKHVTRVLASDFTVRRDIWLLTHPDLLRTPRVDVTWRYLQAALQRDARVFS